MPVCPQLQSSGVCTDNSCTFNHDVLICDDCGVVCTSQKFFDAHINGKKHRKKLIRGGLSGILHCALCEKNIESFNWTAHIHSSSHRQKAIQQGVSANSDPEQVVTDVPGRTYCSICDTHIPTSRWPTHHKNFKHIKNVRFASFKAALEEAKKDKHGVTVTGSLDFEIVEVEEGAQGRTAFLTVTSSVPSSRITIVDVKLASAKNVRVLPIFIPQTKDLTHVLSYQKPATIPVLFRQANVGRYDDRLEVIFEDAQIQKRFVIMRPLRAIVGSKSDHELLRPKAPYIPRKRTSREPETEILPGPPPPTLKVIPWVVKLHEANIPHSLSVTMSTGSMRENIEKFRRAWLPQTLDSESYGRHFKNLLWAEEFRMDRDLEIYDIRDAVLTRHSSLYYLEVPGLAEKRPSVLVGDRILVQKYGDARGKWYEGHVHVVRDKEVGLRFHESFSFGQGARYTVHFKLNRFPLKRQHQALDTAFSPARVLFPTERDNEGLISPFPTNSQLRFFNRLIASNPAQRRAVLSILKQKPGAVPFAVFGPPGTGKTVTVVEAIRQLLQQNPKACILACAPSNSAADLIAQRLSDLGPDELFRFYAPSRTIKAVPDSLKPYTATFNLRTRDESADIYDLHFSIPPMSRMKRFKVIVSTCVSASMPYGIGMTRGHFTHIFIDEAGQATEPEVMIPIKTMADNSTNIVLSGDPKQLGPIIRSGAARELGLEKSYLERLMECELYDEQRGHGLTVVKLTQNFRSHKSILKFPNERFYRGDLEQCGDPKTINAFIGSDILVSKRFPIVFHATSGEDTREASSPSFFNIHEALQVKSYIEKLRGDRQVRISDRDIGVITPYHAQVQKIRTLLRPVADEVKVGSVEEFQGQERRVIIISTVRSSRELVEYDLRHTLGFVASPRRFNVSVTRAQALLIVIGDPSVLSLDPLWRSFLSYIHTSGGWKGQPITWDPQAQINEHGGYDQNLRELGLADMNEFTRRMESLTLSGVDPGNGNEETEANVDRPWREVE